MHTKSATLQTVDLVILALSPPVSLAKGRIVLVTMTSQETSDTYIQDAPSTIQETQDSGSELTEPRHAYTQEQNYNQEGLVNHIGDMMQDAHHHDEHDPSANYEHMDQETDV